VVEAAQRERERDRGTDEDDPGDDCEPPTPCACR
jgi:hypothetical protein